MKREGGGGRGLQETAQPSSCHQLSPGRSPFHAGQPKDRPCGRANIDAGVRGTADRPITCRSLRCALFHHVPSRGSMVGADRLNVPAIDTFSHCTEQEGGGGGQDESHAATR